MGRLLKWSQPEELPVANSKQIAHVFSFFFFPFLLDDGGKGKSEVSFVHSVGIFQAAFTSCVPLQKGSRNQVNPPCLPEYLGRLNSRTRQADGVALPLVGELAVPWSNR